MRTNLYTPEMNGPFERMNNSVIGKAKLLIFDESYETRFQIEAANIIINNKS